MKKVFKTVLCLFVLMFVCSACYFGFGMLDSEQETESKPDKLSGAFTVNSSGKKVQFSKGALYWDGSALKMENNQYDFRTWSGNKSVINGKYMKTPENNTGLFYWTKDKAKTYVQNYDSTKSFSFALANGGAIAGWDVLSKEEWDYLTDRKDSNNKFKYGLATITTGRGAEVVGLVLLPDSWETPDRCTWTAGCASGWTTNKYNATKWAKMEQAGAVFLPVAYSRVGSAVNHTDDVFWWSSTPYSGYNAHSGGSAYGLRVTKSYGSVYFDYVGNGNGVRLVAVVSN